MASSLTFDDLPDVAGPSAPASGIFDDLPELNKSAAPPASPVPTGIGATFSDIWPEIKGAASSALSSINAGLNPFSAEHQASVARQVNAPDFLSGVGEGVKGVGQMGSALAAIPSLISSPLTGASRSLLGHPMAAIENIPYSEAKDQADLAMMGLSPRGASPIGVRPGAPTAPAPAPSLSDLKASASAGFKKVQQSGATIDAGSLSDFGNIMQQDLKGMGLRQGVHAPETFSFLDTLTNPPKNAVVTPADLKIMREQLGQTAGSPDPRERLAATTVKNAFDNYTTNLPPSAVISGNPSADAATLQQAVGDYAASKRAQDFDLRGQKAQNNADAANSGMNLENNLRTQVRQILNNPKLQRGYDADTMAAFKAFNGGSRGANIIRMVGNALGGGGGWGTIATGAIGHMVFPGGGEAAPAVGMAIKHVGNMRAASQFDRLGQMIRAASPLGRSLPPVAAPAPNPFLAGPAIANKFLLPQMLGLGMPAIGASANQQ